MGIPQHHRHPLDLAIGFETIDEALLAGIFHRLGGDQGHLLWRQGELDVEQHAGAQLTVRIGDDHPRLDVLGIVGDAAVQRLQHAAERLIRPGRTGRRHRHAGAQQREVALGHRQIEPQLGQLVQVEQGIAAVDQGPFAQIDEADRTVERRQQGAQGELVLGGIGAGLSLGDRGLLPLELRGGDGAARHQPAHVPQLAALVAHAGALLGQLRLLLAGVEGDQHVPLLDLLAGAHRNLDDAAGHFRAYHHGAVGGQLAHQLDGGFGQALADRLRPDVDLTWLGFAGRGGVAVIPAGGNQQREAGKHQPYTHFHQAIHEIKRKEGTSSMMVTMLPPDYAVTMYKCDKT